LYSDKLYKLFKLQLNKITRLKRSRDRFLFGGCIYNLDSLIGVIPMLVFPVCCDDENQSLIYIYRMPQEECARLREGVPYVKVYRYNPKHLCPNLNGYGDNGQRSLKL